ncbi:hypothetical protein GCM10007877_14930 [Marinibactrum halimedae]|uniref:HNH domain-containing protein n=1 Tax=Marinibactrum halimedae TaxID=1444977 RepID=A0AA37T4T5_9GAMM|nr:hypothetical protein GCM10007877_14930 [Marinibactrum halimedae]
MSERCELCESEHFLTFHHLIPKTCHGNKWFKKHFDKQDMRERGVYLCRRCHSFVHKKFPEKYLGRHLNTLEKLKANDVIMTYVQWVKGKR